mmetsp:Transcript_39806/g.29369  ORF Transcript_39806/g.29369 Transcript_39806/m.29369 type:complete len:91 (-) Transcript_39806:59-331(-)
MEAGIFEYLKTKRAVFEVRHYLVQANKPGLASLRPETQGIDTQRSGITEEDENEEMSDFLTIGWVKVPLLQLITKNTGIDAEFFILDDYK